MSFLKFDGFYPEMFSLKMDALIWFGVLCGGLTALSTLAAEPVVSTTVWLGLTVSIYFVAGVFYAPRSRGWSGEEKRVQVEAWGLWILFAIPTILMMSVAVLLWAAGGLTLQEAIRLAYGAGVAACIGTFFSGFVMFVCTLTSLWMESDGG
jgi:hypothetical protein